jgi:hypothetical protein
MREVHSVMHLIPWIHYRGSETISNLSCKNLLINVRQKNF